MHHLRSSEDDRIESTVQGALWSPGWRRPTDLIAKPLPLVFLLRWIGILIIYLKIPLRPG